MVAAKGVDRISKRVGEVVTIPGEASVLDAARRMRQAQVGCLLAVNANGKVVGIVTEHDLAVKIVAPQVDAATTPVADIMTRTIISCAPGTPTHEAQRIMAMHNIRHLPIVENGGPIGMVSSRDILAQQLSDMKAVVQKQAKVLHQLEAEHPGITALQKDHAGRVVI